MRHARPEALAQGRVQQGALGAWAAGDPAEAVRDADVVITMLAGPDTLAAVAEAAVPALRPGTNWIDMSTVGPDAIRDLAARLGGTAALIDAPVVGSTDKAASGELRILAGGAVEGVADVLGVLGEVTRTGPLGTGAALKLVVNSAVLGGVALVAECLRLADALGVEDAVARTALVSGPLGGAAARAFAEGVHFGTELAVKDLDLAAAQAQLPTLEAVLEHYRKADVPDADISAAADRIRTGSTV
ncbi:NAD(P)-dependent oxidoreductase [Streptomyces sp. NPDC059866]|uniref:NAD(P)-dependent oxidoreductase n=1 Tax=Streptomyces sp. NPDC059866 TaxID=3346978 RepID=UPI0036636196